MQRIILITVFSSLLLLGGCTKEYLTEDSKWGNNTFSCKIDGKVYVSKDDLFAQGIVTNYYYGTTPGSFSFRVKANLYTGSKNFGSISLVIKNVKEVGEYTISPSNSEATVRVGNIAYAYAHLGQEGKIIVTRLDISAEILSGNFEFVATKNDNPQHKMTVTKGRFDVKL